MNTWPQRQVLRRDLDIKKSGPRRLLRVESLESRVLLDGAGFVSGTDVHLTLSFAPAGSSIAGSSSALAAKFDTIAPTADWQAAILRAFQTWAVETNADIGLVADSGDPFGTPGPSQGDDRFGEIRIGGIPMATTEVGAVSVPVDGLVAGTWFADVVFNTSYDYQTLADIYAVALHEAGNVFGLEDNSDPNSPLFTGGAPTGLPPTTSDLAALHELYGERLPDLNEFPNEDGETTDNDSFATATQLNLNEAGEAAEGTAPSIVYGDITTSTDVDFFKVQTPDDYNGMMTLQLRSAGISLLAPQVTIYDSLEQQITQATSTSTQGDLLTFQLPVTGDSIYVEVGAAGTDLFAVGGYSLVAVYDGINQISQSTIDSIASGQFRFLDKDEIEKFFDTDEDDHFAVDLNSNDSFLTATELKTTPGFVEASRYETIGSIDSDLDIDYFKIKSPDTGGTPLDVMTVFVRSLDAGELVPQVSLFDKDEQPVSFSILANGGGEIIVQLVGLQPSQNYHVVVAAQDPEGPFNTGNYDLQVTFGSQPTQLAALVTGTIGDGLGQFNHSLDVARPQLFHLALQVDPASLPVPTAVVATIKNDLDETVYQLASRPGETRSRDAVLLNPGSYLVEITAFALDGRALPALNYSLLGVAISDPFVGDPEDPTANPFACEDPSLEGFFCYPGDIHDPDPFLWDRFNEGIADPVDPPSSAAIALNILGDWWRWYWGQSGVNGPPLGVSDAIQVPSMPEGLAALLIGPNGSVLDNDIDPEGDPIVAILQSGPSHGALSIASNGTFTYTPDPGYRGRDSFTYTAFDFTQESTPTAVMIIVGESGDFDADGDTDGADFLAWQRNVTTTTGATLTEGDSNFDGSVDQLDLSQWTDHYVSENPAPLAFAMAQEAAAEPSALPATVLFRADPPVFEAVSFQDAPGSENLAFSFTLPEALLQQAALTQPPPPIYHADVARESLVASWQPEMKSFMSSPKVATSCAPAALRESLGPARDLVLAEFSEAELRELRTNFFHDAEKLAKQF